MQRYITLFIALVLPLSPWGALSEEMYIGTVKNISSSVNYTNTSAFKAQKEALKNVNITAFARLAFSLYPDLKPSFVQDIRHREVAESLIKFNIVNEILSNEEYSVTVNSYFDIESVNQVIEQNMFEMYKNKICEECIIVPVELKSSDVAQTWNTDWFDVWHEISLTEDIRLPTENIQNIALFSDANLVKKLANKSEDYFLVTLITNEKKPKIKIERIASGQSKLIEFPELNVFSKEEIRRVARQTYDQLLEQLISIDVFQTKSYPPERLIGFTAFADWNDLKSRFSSFDYEILYISEKGCIIEISDKDFSKIEALLAKAGYFLATAGDKEWIAKKVLTEK